MNDDLPSDVGSAALVHVVADLMRRVKVLEQRRENEERNWLAVSKFLRDSAAVLAPKENR